MISPKRLLRTRSGEVVEDNGATSGVLLVAKGAEVSDKDAKEWGLMDEPKAEAKAPEAKAVTAPPENKAVEMPESKRGPGRPRQE